jgi:hypothetical protein
VFQTFDKHIAIRHQLIDNLVESLFTTCDAPQVHLLRQRLAFAPAAGFDVREFFNLHPQCTANWLATRRALITHLPNNISCRHSPHAVWPVRCRRHNWRQAISVQLIQHLDLARLTLPEMQSCQDASTPFTESRFSA